MTQAKEIRIPLHQDYYLTAKHWPGEGIPTLGLHGWLDNAATFDALAPQLKGLNLVALDFPGHGLSCHKPESCYFHILDLVIESFLVADYLGWHQFNLLGHSLGAAIASYMAGTQPERIHQLILIDGLGSLTTSPEKTPDQLARMIQSLHRPRSKPTIYTSLDQAISARLQATPMVYEGAKAIVARGTKQVEGGLTWRTDPRLLQPSAQYLTHDQTLAFLNRIEAPTLVIRPEPGYPFEPLLMQQRLQCIKHLHYVTLEGHHHVHLDSPTEIAAQIHQFTKVK